MALGPPNLAPVVDAFSFPITRRRFAAPTTSSAAGSRGLKVRGAATETTIQAHVWDSPGEIEDDAEDGQRPARRVTGCTTADLRAADDVAGLLADEVDYDGDTFEVKTVGRWSAGSLGARSYIEFTAAKVVR
jgi:hypothetical protein